MPEFVEQGVYHEHCRMCDERFKRDKCDIEKHDSDIDDIKKLTAQISQLVKQNDAVLKKHSARIDAIEKKPSLVVDRIVSACISALVSAIIAGGVL